MPKTRTCYARLGSDNSWTLWLRNYYSRTSAFGGKADTTFRGTSAFAAAIGSKADMGWCIANVRL